MAEKKGRQGKPIQIYLDEALHAWLIGHAEKNGRTLTKEITRAIERYRESPETIQSETPPQPAPSPTSRTRARKPTPTEPETAQEREAPAPTPEPDAQQEPAPMPEPEATNPKRTRGRKGKS